jgi:two-component system, NarL family, sensor histidine kinase BarA
LIGKPVRGHKVRADVDRAPPLNELIDRESLSQACGGLATLLGCPVRVYLPPARHYAGTRVGPADPLSLATVDTLMGRPILTTAQGKSALQIYAEPTGERYAFFPLTAQGDEVGRAIIGPLAAHAATLSNDTLGSIISGVLEPLVFLGLKTAVTNGLHLRLMDDTYAELERKNGELETAVARLQEVSRMKSSFLQTVSHELKTPLTAVIGYAEALLEGLPGPLNDEQKTYVETILVRGETLLSMINGLLDITRLAASYHELDLAPFRPGELVDIAIDSYVGETEREQVEIVREVADGLPVIYVESNRLGRALAALVHNAIKFSQEGAAVIVRAYTESRPKPGLVSPFESPDEDYVVFEVTDHGIGIAADKLPHVFESFYQVDASTTRRHGGVGLGLTVARNFVETHRGRIEITSEPGQGTTAKIVFRLRDVAEPPVADPAGEKAPSPSPPGFEDMSGALA